MKKQIIVPVTALQAEFNEKKEKAAEYQYMGILQALSKALKDLQDIGIDVGLEISTAISEESFKLVQGIGGPASCSVYFSGVLRIGTQERLLVLSATENVRKRDLDGSTKDESIDMLKIFVSSRDYASRKIESDFRGLCFDLNEDAKAIYKLQQFIIEEAADNEAITENDIHDAFSGPERQAKLKKAPARQPHL